MSTPIRDLWPADIKSEEVVSPEEILKHQARQLEARTSGLLLAHVVRTVSEDRMILGFEIESPRAARRLRLLSVEHRLNFEYPAAIIPPADDLPSFLREQALFPGAAEMKMKNQWVASSPSEFSQKLEQVLSRSDVKAAVLSLLSRRGGRTNGVENQDPQPA